jgi:hypothetical protein
MIPPLFFYQLALLGLLWLCVMLHLAWPSPGPVSSRWSVAPETPVKSRRKRSNEPTPLVGLTYKPPCALCAYEASHPMPLPPVRPAPIRNYLANLDVTSCYRKRTSTLIGPCLPTL